MREVKRSDILADVEKVTGKHWSEFNDSENGLALMLHLAESKRLEKEFKSMEDTYFGIHWNEFKELLIKNGFKEGLSYDFDYQGSVDEAIIYYHTDGIIVFATSFGNKSSVNEGKAYLEMKGEDCWNLLHSGGLYNKTEWLWSNYFDIREGMFQEINKLKTNCEILKQWRKPDSWLWFVDYTESKAKDYDYKEITNRKIELLPEECRYILNK